MKKIARLAVSAAPGLLGAIHKRWIPQGKRARPMRRAIVADHPGAEPGQQLKVLGRVGDGGGSGDECRGRSHTWLGRPQGIAPTLVNGTHPPQPPQHARDLRTENAAVGVRLVDHDVAQVAEELGPQRVVGQDAGVEHVGVGQQHARAAADTAARGLGRVAVVGGGQRVDDPLPRGLHQRIPLAELILCQRLGRVDVQGARQRITRQRLQHRHVKAQRLAAGRRGGDDDVLARQRGVDRLGLVRVQPLGAGRGQRSFHRRAERYVQVPVTRPPRGQGLDMRELPGITALTAQGVEEGDRVKSHFSIQHTAGASAASRRL